eukprot:CAMPEP_0194159460 /NCGR_PEP_ID=MMETSP0152-20130528/77843_1 /TAXON_ID=1049557 /ORGANISM="Thalassiothrix antarctica, Strain L6-D1" /LENGTH=720 /DNA_ID=CAMNT_0038869029 /DNA_START=127 /DNA_END=2286 /DNA_ORIENTATION=-
MSSSPNFGSTSYAASFENLPVPDVDALRRSALKYLNEDFSKEEWYDNPMISILNGEKMTTTSEEKIETKDAFGIVNGYQQLATPQQVSELENFITTYVSPSNDLRSELRAVETELLTTHAGFLIGTQCMDFGKQDGITELEEATMANAIERRLNDMLLSQEKKAKSASIENPANAIERRLNDMLLSQEIEGKVRINRKPIFVGCVSNFTLFLDLFRKTIRSLELGIPCVILGRNGHTSQHHYRWTELLVSLLKQHKTVSSGMVTFLSASLEDIKRILKKSEERNNGGNLYTTCSRHLAKQIKEGYSHTVASTGGPNTLLATDITSPDIAEAIRMSSSIESSGQCTALRHCIVLSSVEKEDVERIFVNKTTEITNPIDAVEKKLFDGIYKHHNGSSANPTSEEYNHLEEEDVYWKLNNIGELPSKDLNEYWRRVVVDFSQLDNTDNTNTINSIATWLNREQPITLAINVSSATLAKALFEKTGLVVYTIGSDKNPGLTCQARPQEGEVFGEFPPRNTMSDYTKFPVVVPSSTPSYDTHYVAEYLQSLSNNQDDNVVKRLVRDHVQDTTIRGYCYELLSYLEDATRINPKRGVGTSRTSLWGLQRPPIGTKTLLRCSDNSTFDALAPVLILFLATNANDQYEVSIPAASSSLKEICDANQIVYSDDEQDDSCYYNIVTIDTPDFVMVGQFVSLYMNLGHIKSTKSQDEDFVQELSQSIKWLR